MRNAHHGAVIAPGVLLGAGLGGFLDGILLHQILQWHNMLSSVRPPTDLVSMKVNMLWDGLFHAFTWLTTVTGVALLWRAGQKPNVPWSTKSFLGGIALGFGAFNFIEGLIDHQILGIHHVHPGENQDAWDVGFLASGVMMMALGWGLLRSARSQVTPRRTAKPLRAAAT